MTIEPTDMDRKIMRELVKDARISHVLLSEKVGLSPTACARRLQQLEQSGVIRGYSANIDAAGLGTGDSFWLYPGARASRVAARLLKRTRNRTASRTDGKPASWRGRLIEVAKGAYREHFRAAARWGDAVTTRTMSSPGAIRPKRWMMVVAVTGQRLAASSAIRASSVSAIPG